MKTSFGYGILCLLLATVTGGSLSKAAVDGSGLSTSVAVDLLGSFDLSKDSGTRNALDVREAEVSLFAPIDHQFDGVLSLAAHNEKGESLFELHEANIGSSKLISGLSFKLGQYFLSIGRLNRFHRHDWPFTSAPKVFTEFFGSEGILDSGLEASYLLPVPVYLNLTAGVTNGRTFGHSHSDGERPDKPTHYFRLSTFAEGESFDLSTGVSYLSRTSAEGEKLELKGFDGIIKHQGMGYPLVLVQSEIWHREKTPKKGETHRAAGGYLYPQYGLSKSFFTGVRFDYFTVLSLKNALGDRVANSEQGIVPTLTYKHSEFASFKLAYNHIKSTQARLDDSVKRSVEIQSTFILGAHPAHDF